MIDILFIAIGIISGFLLFFKIPIIKKTKIDHIRDKDKILKISIIIPCRNEEKNISELLDALAKQTYPIFEIICVDDISEDKTAEIISSKNATLIKIEKHPVGWIGKTYAVHTGAQAAHGDTLLFLDADLKLENDAIETLVSAYKKFGTISVQPYHKMKQPYEQMALFFNLSVVAGTGIALPFPRQRGMFGPLIMIDKQLYLKAGGHSAVKHCVVEDFMLGLHYKKIGIVYKLFIGDKNIAFRMYPDGLRSQFEGYTKNISTGILSTGVLTALLTFLWITATISVPINLIKSIAAANFVNIGVFAVACIIILAQLSVYGAKIGSYKPYFVPLYPIALIWFLVVILYSFLRKFFFRSVTWKNRKIKI